MLYHDIVLCIVLSERLVHFAIVLHVIPWYRFMYCFKWKTRSFR